MAMETHIAVVALAASIFRASKTGLRQSRRRLMLIANVRVHICWVMSSSGLGLAKMVSVHHCSFIAPLLNGSRSFSSIIAPSSVTGVTVCECRYNYFVVSPDVSTLLLGNIRLRSLPWLSISKSMVSVLCENGFTRDVKVLRPVWSWDQSLYVGLDGLSLGLETKPLLEQLSCLIKTISGSVFVTV